MSAQRNSAGAGLGEHDDEPAPTAHRATWPRVGAATSGEAGA